MPSTDSKLVTYRVRFDVPGMPWLVTHEVKAVSLDAVYEWAEEQYDPMWYVAVYDITPLAG